MKHVMKRKTGKTMRQGCFTRTHVSILRFGFAIVTCRHVEIKSSGGSHTNSRKKGRVKSMPHKYIIMIQMTEQKKQLSNNDLPQRKTKSVT